MFFNRARELGYLSDRYNAERAEIIVLYGRRRVGKAPCFSNGRRVSLASFSLPAGPTKRFFWGSSPVRSRASSLGIPYPIPIRTLLGARLLAQSLNWQASSGWSWCSTSSRTW